MKGKFLKSILLVVLILCTAPISYAQLTQASGSINSHEYVDLGLSVMWATCNVGANSPEEYGNYYAWGETSPKSTYTKDNCTSNKNIGDIAGNPNYDAARANWGDTWRMPTKKEIQELIDNCTTEYTTHNGVNGMLVTSKINGNSIFLPAAGFRYESSIIYAGEYGRYWGSSSNGDKLMMCYLYFDDDSFDWNMGYCYDARSVRPVMDGNTTTGQQTQIASLSSDGDINGHEYVDLGLSVMWATCNIGASSPEEYGNYYAWGEKKTKSTYTDKNSVAIKKKINDDIAGNSNYDAARANWGGTWRLPTRIEIGELINNCTTEWITHNGVKGLLVKSKINGNSIFLPAAGYRYESSLNSVGELGYYWSSSHTNGIIMHNACDLYFGSAHFDWSWINCSYGQSVRPVSVGSTATKQQTQSSNIETSAPQQTTISSKDLGIPSGTINGYDYVDLGLSVKWATCNVGASSPEISGNFYAWGETSPKSTYPSDNGTTWGKNMGDIAGNSNYDVARANWGGTWRLPTKNEIQELIDNCTTEWTTRNGVNGMLVTSKINGNSIFLPAAGFRRASSLNDDGESGNYWSSSPDESDSYIAYDLYLGRKDFVWSWDRRSRGQSVRPVSE